MGHDLIWPPDGPPGYVRADMLEPVDNIWSLKWYIEWDETVKEYAVKRGKFCDSTHRHKYEAEARKKALEEGRF